MAASAAVAAEQLRQAESYKDEGNRWYGQGNYKKALGAYHKVFCYVNGIPVSMGFPAGAGEEEKARAEEVKKIKQATRINMAACYLKLEEHQKCVDACTAALELGPGLAKAHFRRGQAHAELRNFAGARGDLERARELAPDDAAIVAELRRVRDASSRGDADEKKKYAKMFAKAPTNPSDLQGGGEGGACPLYAAEEGVANRPLVEGVGEELPLVVEPVAEALSGASPPGWERPLGGAEPPQGGDQKKLAGAPLLAKAPTGATVQPVTTQVLDEARKLDFTVRELTYSWQQSDEDVKIYIPFDQSPELEGGVDETRVQVEYGEWSTSLIIHCVAEGRPPLGLRLGDFFRRLAPEKCRCTIRSNRITLKLVKQAKEHWWNLLQHAPLHSG